MKCKKTIMGLAALLIFIFHFYIPFSNSHIELAIYKSTYIGVDLFFFVSAYSLSQRSMDSYWGFIKNRLVNVYIPFVGFAILSAIINHWTINRLLCVVCGYEFFSKGGGAFLWFLIAIMMVYLISPFVLYLKKKYGYKSFILLCIIWATLVGTLQYGLGYTNIFILLNRLPVFFVGLFYESIREHVKGKFKYLLIIITLIVGGFLIYQFGSIIRLNKPIADFYYIVALPFTVALVALFDFISENSKIKNVPLQLVGKVSLELYGLQMVFGFPLESYLLKSVGQYKQLAFLVTFLILFLCSLLLNYVRIKITKK